MAEPDWVWLYARHRDLKDTLVSVMATVLGDTRPNGPVATRHMANELSCKGMHMLLAEDNPVNVKLMKVHLKAFGCTFDAVTNGQDACDALKENNYDVVLMDVQMPVMNGLDATQIIRKEINSQVPIIAVTASALWMISCPNPSMPKHLRRNYGDGGRLKNAYKRGLGFGIYDRLDEWGYGHESVNHAAGDYARDDDGDGFCEVHN
jgi:hypothetical protein